MSNESTQIPATDEPEPKPRAGIGGWLLVYTLFAGVLFSFLMPLWSVLQLPRGGFWGIVEIEILRFILGAVGLYLIVSVRNPITRYYHIALCGVFGWEFFILGAVTLGLPMLNPVSIGMFGSSVYWLVSKRVLATYARR